MKTFNPSIRICHPPSPIFECGSFDKNKMSAKRTIKRDAFFRKYYFLTKKKNIWNKIHYTYCGACKVRNKCDLYSFKFAEFLKLYPCICTRCYERSVHPFYVYVIWKLRDITELKFYCCTCFRNAFHEKED